MRHLIITFLCAGLVLMPVQRSRGVVVQCGIALLLIAVVGTGIYVIHKCNENSKDHCYHCDHIVQEDQTTCPQCGYAFRCEVCNTELGADDTACPTCGTKKPDPVPVDHPPIEPNSLQMSTDGTQWQTIIPPSGKTFQDDLQIMSFADQTAFDNWLTNQSDVVAVQQVGTISRQGFFRLAHE